MKSDAEWEQYLSEHLGSPVEILSLGTHTKVVVGPAIDELPITGRLDLSGNDAENEARCDQIVRTVKGMRANA